MDTETKEALFHQKVAFPALETLQVRGSNSLKSVFPASLVSSLRQLRSIDIWSCKNMETIITKEGEEDESIIVFEGLQELILDYLPNLASFYRTSSCPGKDTNNIQDLPLFDKRVTFPALEKLYIRSLGKLKSLFSLFIARSLGQLKYVEISDCEFMETIIAKEEQGDKEDCIEMIDVFPQLHELQLERLPSLTNFYLGTSTLNWPLLKKFKITNIKGNLDHDHMRPLFNKMVKFPALELLEIKYVHKFSSVVTFSLLQSLQSLGELSVIRCDSLEEVVVKVEDHEINVVLFPQLRKLTLKELPKVKHIMCWDKCPMEKLGFRNLIKINIVECNSMKSLLPTSIATDLVQLQELEIDSCKLIETIFANETQGKENSSGMIVFPKLHTLKLTNLPNLLSFYLELYMSSHTKLDMSSLKTLWIWCCPAMKTFAYSIPCPQKLRISDEIISKETPEKSNSSIYHRPLFNNKVGLSNLEELRVGFLENVLEIFEGHEVITFNQLKNLCFHELPNLQTFCSGNYSLELPSLFDVELVNCPKMQTFNRGFISTPQLKQVKTGSHEYVVWGGNLNSTVQLIHEKETLGKGNALGGDEPSNKQDSDILTMQLQVPEICRLVEAGGSSEEKGKAEITAEVREDNMLNHMPSQDISTQMGRSTKEEKLLTTDMGVALEDDVTSFAKKNLEDQRVYQNIGLGKVMLATTGVLGNEPSNMEEKAVNERSEGLSQVTSTSSHQPHLDGGITNRGSTMEEDPQTPMVDVVDSGGFVPLANSEADMSNLVGSHPSIYDHLNKNHINPDEMVISRTEFESLKKDRDLLTQRVDTLENLLSHTHPNEMVIGYQRERDLLRQRVEILEDLLCHGRIGEMVSGNHAEFETIQRDRDLLRRWVETLEDLTVTRNRGGRPPGLSMTLGVGWVAWSCLIMFGVLFFFLSFFSF